jgi:hypothetical protein
MVQIHATLDDVGNCKKDGISAVVGYVAYREAWNKFNWRWMMTLEQLKRPFLHTAEYLNQFPLADGRITGEDICLILAPFIEAVKGTLLAEGAVPICVITECAAYDQLTAQEKKYIRPPEENSFEIAVAVACRVLRNPLNISDSIAIQMDESVNAPRLYSRYEAMKRENDELKSHLGAICFCDDRRHPPVQAADMLGNVVLKSFRKFESGGDMPRALRELTFVDGQSRLRIWRYDLDNLHRLAQLRLQRAARMEMPDTN